MVLTKLKKEIKMESSVMNDKKVSKSYINPYIGGGILGVVLFLAFFITGNGLGASGAITRIQVFIVDIFASGHVDSVGYFAKYGGGDKSAIFDKSVLMLLGTVLGGAISAFFGGRLKFETNKGEGMSDKTRWLLAFVGGMIMVYGARFARGCTSGQGLSGGSVLSVGSWILVVDMLLHIFFVSFGVEVNYGTF